MKESQTFLTVGREYEVQAVAVFRGFPVLQVVDDLGGSSWRASWLFDVVERSIPTDWICNILHEEPAMLLGPEFVAKDEDSYGAMVELEAEQVDRFWKRVNARRIEDETDM
ncbi:hypothetical protein [Sorangium sp. So ce1097]|uniref:hypothetical protein n=1 Tax=Sorangium sp. So ce1097 TaxID=3133330 RepID=UPI003F628767